LSLPSFFPSFYVSTTILMKGFVLTDIFGIVSIFDNEFFESGGKVVQENLVWYKMVIKFKKTH